MNFSLKFKKIGAIFLIFLLLSSFLNFSNSITVFADSGFNESEANYALEDSILDLLKKLDLSNLEEYLEEIKFGFEDTTLKERLLEWIKGDNVDYQEFFTRIFDVFFKEIKEFLPAFICITAIALTCGIMSAVSFGVMDQSLKRLISLIAFISALIPLLNILQECYSSIKNGVVDLKNQMEILFPLLLTLMAASGSGASVAVCRPSVAFLSTAMISLVRRVLLPISMILIAFSICGKLSDDFKFGKFIGVLKSVNKWMIGIGVSIFGLFLTIQGIAAGTYDGVIRRVTKYAIGTGVPIVGGFLSGGFDLAVAGSVLIKNSLGYLGVFLMITTICQPLLIVCSSTLLLRLVSAITSPFSEGKISDFLSETADHLNYMSAGMLFTAFLYFLSILIVICSSGVLL